MCDSGKNMTGGEAFIGIGIGSDAGVSTGWRGSEKDEELYKTLHKVFINYSKFMRDISKRDVQCCKNCRLYPLHHITVPQSCMPGMCGLGNEGDCKHFQQEQRR